MGTRLGRYTEEKPKGMVEFAGTPVIQRQIETLRSEGVDDIVIVRGYQAGKIDFPNVRYYENPLYSSTNMIESLLCARLELQGEVLILYSDIVFESRVLRAVLDAACPLGVAVDTDFREYWLARTGSTTEDNESLCIGEGGLITEMGENDPLPEKMHARYMGMIRLNAEGCRGFLKRYDQLRNDLYESQERWKNSRCFRQGFMTDMLQALIDQGIPVSAIPVKRGWLEIDTVKDLELYESWIEQGTLGRFFDLS